VAPIFKMMSLKGISIAKTEAKGQLQQVVIENIERLPARLADNSSSQKFTRQDGDPVIDQPFHCDVAPEKMPCKCRQNNQREPGDRDTRHDPAYDAEAIWRRG
jgi:hypothetical protein